MSSKNIRSLKNSVGLFALSIALSACLQSEEASHGAQDSTQFIEAQSKIYAQSIQQYATRSQHLLTNSSNWLNGAALDSDLINAAALGGDFGAAEELVHSGYCADTANPGKALHITWFEQENDGGEFVLKGIGSGVGNKNVLISTLKKNNTGNNIGIHRGNKISFFADAGETNLPAGCNGFNIPENAPVIAFRIDIPQKSQNSSIETAYRLSGCAAGMSGHIVQSINIENHWDGKKTAGTGATKVTLPKGSTFDQPAYNSLWTTYSDNCKENITLSSIQSEATTFQAVDLSAMIAAGLSSPTLNTINNSLSSVDCKEVKQEEMDENEQGNANGEAEEFETCGQNVTLSTLDGVEETYVTVDNVENVTRSCGGTSGQFNETINGYTSQASFPAWSGDAVYSRTTHRYSVDDDLSSNGGNDARRYRENWQGVSLDCSRLEQISFTCSEVHGSQFSGSQYSVTQDDGYRYQRNNQINGWLSPVSLVPNSPTNPNWSFQSAASGCAWREEETWECAQGSPVQNGLRHRDTTSSDLYSGTSTSAWSLQQPAQCEETRRVGGCNWTDQERVFTSNAPGEGSWSGWRTSASGNDCPAIPAPQTRRIGGCNWTDQQRTYTQNPDGTGAWGNWTTVGTGDDCVVVTPEPEPPVVPPTPEPEPEPPVTPPTPEPEPEPEPPIITPDPEPEPPILTPEEECVAAGNTWIVWTNIFPDSTAAPSCWVPMLINVAVCLAGNVKVAMADGSSKQINQIEVGEMTLTGRVTQKYQRRYKADEQHTIVGNMVTKGGLYTFDGITGTGQHLVHTEGSWKEMSACEHAHPTSGTDTDFVYNLLVENHVIPVVGDSGEIYAFTDDLNNVNNSSEKGRIMLANMKLTDDQVA